jgi:hypothetical protein
MKATPLLRMALACCALGVLAPGQLSAQDYRTWYLAEGTTTFTFEQEILVANPNDVTVRADLDLLMDDGTVQPVHGLEIQPFRRLTIPVNTWFPTLAGRSLSARLTSDRPVLVERSMYWGGAHRRGGHNASGVTSPGTEWHFAEGALGRFQTYLLIGNPGATMALVQVRYMTATGAVHVDNLHVMPGERRTIPVNQWQPSLGQAFSMHVTSDQPVLAERAMYWDNFGGGHAAVGVKQPLTLWRFAEGSTLGVFDFQTFVLLSNPGATNAMVHVSFYRDGGGPPIIKHVTVGAGSRLNIWVNDTQTNPDLAALANSSFSFVVESDEPIVAERAMYWGNFVEGHVTAGAEQEATAWGFAEGLEDRHGGLDYDTYFLFVNANPAPMTLTGTFYREDGRGVVRSVTVPANSRHTWAAREIPELTNQRFAAFFQANLPFVAERAVYWGMPYRGGHVSVGTPWTAAIPAPPEPPPASITDIAPRFGARAGGNQVIVSGSNFSWGSRVFFGNAEAAVHEIMPDFIRVSVPPNAPSTLTVTVLGGYGASPQLPGVFTYLNAAANGPSIASYPAWRAFPVNYLGVVQQVANERPDLLWNSCANNEFMFAVVRRLRQATGSNRWGLNWKRGNTGDLSQDVVAYYWGPEGVEMEGSTQVFLIDMIYRHCGPEYGVGAPGPNWEDVTDITYAGGSRGRWTGYGRFF